MIKKITTACRLLRIVTVILQYQCTRQLPGVRLRKTLETLGPIFVKFGQVLSTRSDLLSEPTLKELAKLQDKVPPFDAEKAKRIIEKSLGKPIDTLFAHFDMTPLASASIAQVHAATLHDGTAVVVKVLRPKIARTIRHDLALLKILARLLERCSRKIRRFKPKAMVEEFKKTILDELDLMREAANASQLRRNFLDSAMLYIPKIVWSHTEGQVLTQERIYGQSIADMEQLNALGVHKKILAENIVTIFFTQVFRDCFFHADLHPGNLFVDCQNIHQPRFIAVDFGIVGTLSTADQRYLAENFLAFFKRDYRRVAALHIESGWVPKHICVEDFASAIRTVCEPLFEKSVRDISFGKTLLRLFKTAERFDMNIQPQFLLLQKTLLSVEGLSRQLHPDIDLWQTAKPFLEQWMKNQMGLKSLLRRARLPEFPDRVLQLLDRVLLAKT